MTITGNTPNRLIREKSPYLLQHAHNPVHWYPWCPEAFQMADKEDKPVFLSIGYSTCHWCHVMEKESFENQTVADLLNRDYVAVKVDREERPDIDAVYMAACQVLTGSGGWPLTIIMTPDQKPFFAATYIPAQSRFGLKGMTELLPAVADQWKKDRGRLLRSAEELSLFLKSQEENHPETREEPERELLDRCVDLLAGRFDSKDGGFGPAPKFPSPHVLLFLMAYGRLEQMDNPFAMVEKTLDQMYRGGLFDHVGGGFSRYSTDRRWLIPHFEKMLYDNALLALTYTEGFLLMGNRLYREVAERTLEYILRELTHPQGGFYCGQDADSEGEEGKYYTFTPEEVLQVLGQEEGGLFCRLFDIEPSGNFEGRSIPNLLKNQEYQEAGKYVSPEARKELYEYRLQRTHLHKDDKVLTSWNGLAIAAFARAYQILEEPRYYIAAKSGAAFILERSVNQEGRLMVRYRDGEAAVPGQLDDYAFFVYGLLELYRTRYEPEYLETAKTLTRKMIDLFWDEGRGGFYLYGKDAEQLLVRPKEVYDGAMPSGNSVAALVLTRLSRLDEGESLWGAYSSKQMHFLSDRLSDYPPGHCFSLLAMIEYLYPWEVSISCRNGVCTPIIGKEAGADGGNPAFT